MAERGPIARVEEIREAIEYKLSRPVRYPRLSFMEQRRHLDMELLKAVRRARNEAGFSTLNFFM